MMLARRQILAGTALLAGSVLTQAMRSQPTPIAGKAADLKHAFPEHVAGWTKAVLPDFILPPEDSLSRSIYTTQVLEGYRNPAGDSVYCLIAYGAIQDYTLQLHRPEVCYEASGFSISSTHAVALQILNHEVSATAMKAERETRKETVLFWTRVGNAYPLSQWGIRGEIAKGWFKRRLPDGVLVRFSSTSMAGQAGLGDLERFAQSLMMAMPEAAQTLIMGERT